MLKYYRHGRLIYSLDGSVKEFPSINQAKAHVRKVIVPAYGEVLSNAPGSVRKDREQAWKQAVKAEADRVAEETRLREEMKAQADAAAAETARVAEGGAGAV